MIATEQIQELSKDNPLLWNIAKFLIVVIVILIIIKLLRNHLKKNIPNTSIIYKSQTCVEILGYIVLVIIAISYFTGTIKDFTLIIGLFTAGIAFTLQELILSIAGSLYIFLVKVYAHKGQKESILT